VATHPADRIPATSLIPLQSLFCHFRMSFRQGHRFPPSRATRRDATALSYVPSLSLRPFATTSKYNGPTVDLQQAGREMRVTTSLLATNLKTGDQLQITLEAVDG